MKTDRSIIELLESRIAPASVLHVIDVDGDKITITASHGTVTADTTSSGAGVQIELIHLDTPDANHANLTISVSKVTGGDGLVNIPRIDAGTNDLGTVTIKGDLGEIDAGSATPGVAAIQALNVNSIGHARALYQTLYATNGGDGVSFISGQLTKLNVTHDVETSVIEVGGGGALISGTIGGSVKGGTGGDPADILVDGNLVSLTIKGSLMGGTGTVDSQDGAIVVGHDIDALTIDGSLIGGAGSQAGFVQAGNIVKLTIGKDIKGGSAPDAGEISSAGDILSASIKGSLIGGTRIATGFVVANNITSITIGGSIVGGIPSVGGEYDSGTIYASGNIGTLKIAHDLNGANAGLQSGTVQSGGDITTAIIGGSMIGQGTAGNLLAGGRLHFVSVGGSLQGGTIEGNGIDIVSIAHDIVGLAYDDTGVVNAEGFGIGKITVGGKITAGSGANTAQIRG